ncbi:MAG: acyltransferase family protein [Pseudomonadota bacterium]
MKYRTEIDGLRAVAVVPVILFHAGLEVFGGGFVGVDVFFVISGYLITTILINDLEKGNFSITRFYERRARRILPALFFVIAVTFPLFFIFLLPDELANYSRSIVAVSFFVSNILFWRETGYFAAASEEQPLLHTWSLAVEEQYYLLFPVFLLLLWAAGRDRVFWTIVAIALMSLALSEWGWRHKPDANFYLAPTRAWELFAGSLAAFMVAKHGVRGNNTLSAVGLTAIIVSIFFYGSGTPFPSVYALLPVIGVVLIILFAGKDTYTARILSTKPMVGIGLISYSAYLWHQPLFALARITSPEDVSTGGFLLLAALSIALAYGSWRFVEAPFRGNESILKNRKHVFLSSLFGLLTLVAVGVTGHVTRGYEFRLTAAQKEILAYKDYPRQGPYREGTCFLTEHQGPDAFDPSCSDIDGTGYMIWGDSHAAALASGFSATGYSFIQRAASSCPPLIDFDVEVHRRPLCPAVNATNLEFLAQNNQHTVILHANWASYREEALESLHRSILMMRSVGAKNIILVGGVPHYRPSLPKVLFRQRIHLKGPYASNIDQSDIAALDQRLRSIAEDTGIAFVSALDVFCDTSHACVVVIPSHDGFAPVAWDEAHLTVDGAIYLNTRLFIADSRYATE